MVLVGDPCDLFPMWERLNRCLNVDLHCAPFPLGHSGAPLDHEVLWETVYQAARPLMLEERGKVSFQRRVDPEEKEHRATFQLGKAAV